MAGHHNKISVDAQTDSYLSLFDGDLRAAVRALYRRSHRDDNKTIQHPPKGEVLIKVTGLSKHYKVGRRKVQALNDVSLSIHKGEFVALTGASGSGKSTLLQLIGGLDKPSAGTITIDGVGLTKMRDKELSQFRGQTIGFVFQFFYLQPFLRLGQNLEVPGMFAGTKQSVRRERMHELATAVGLADRLTHLPRELSGGQMQRAAVARALLNNPKVLLADEPTGNLDSQNSAAIIELFEEIRKTYGTTIVIVTHDDAIARHADREITLRDGVIV